MAQPRILVIVGPTASGKSALAVRLARKLDGEVISADSRQVYKGLDIGTGKITKKEMRGIPHHMMDIVNPSSVFTAHDFIVHGRKAIEDILARGKVPIICGGTGFYIDALLGHITLPDVPANPTLRKRLSQKSPRQLFTILKKLDLKRAKSIDAHNPVRLIRAIEIAKTLGKVPVRKQTPLPYRLEWLGIKLNDATLRKRIHKRLLARMKEGMLREAKRLHREGLSYKRMSELGLEYRYLADFLQKKIDKTELLRKIEQGNIEYTKRQMTYWRRNKEIKWRAM